MKKSILNLGKALNKADQKEISGGMLTPIKFKCIVNYGDPRCCTPSECGETHDPSKCFSCAEPSDDAKGYQL